MPGNIERRTGKEQTYYAVERALVRARNWPGKNVFRLCLTALALLTAPCASAQSKVEPARLAIVLADPSLAKVGDLLTAELSKSDNLQLLERAQIEKVYREQALSAGNRDCLKLGQLLGADGLLLLERIRDTTKEWLSVQLVAVKPGVLLSSERYAWPIPKLAQWAAGISTHLSPLLPKLGVLAKDALPISVVNLRSAIQSSQSREVERQLTLLAIEQLSREKRLFVLERRKMQLMTEEKDLNGLDDSAFWDGSYLLDGVLDRNGYSQDTITISARLMPPEGGAPLQIEASGSRTNYADVINHLVHGILKALTINGQPAPWKPAEEADQFYAEAQWACQWKLYPQAQAAAESAWALGKRTTDAAQVLVRSYTESVVDWGAHENRLRVLQVPDASAFPPVDRGFEFVLQNHQVLFTQANAMESFKLGVRLLRQAFGLLESYYYAAEMRPEHADELLGLREKVRRMFKLMDVQAPAITNAMKWDDPRLAYAKLKWSEGGAAFEHPEDALGFYRDCLVAGARPETPPRIIGWTWPDRERAPAATRRLVEDACASTNTAVRLEGSFLVLLQARDEEPGGWRSAEEKLVSAMWENRAVLLRDAGRATLVERIRQALVKRTGDYDIGKAFAEEPFANFKHQLRMDFLAHGAETNAAVLKELFPETNVKMETPDQARELLPLMESLRQNPALSQCIEPRLEILRRSAGLAKKIEPTPPLKAATVLEARFVPWHLNQSGLYSNRTPRSDGMIFRDGRLWVCVRHLDPQEYESSDTSPTSFLAVDPQRGVTAEISFPGEYGAPGKLFEVSQKALFAEARGNLYEYKFQEKNWTRILVPMEGASSFAWLDGRLFIGRRDGLLAVNPESTSVQVLVSARRKPPANAIDPLWSADTKVFPLADGKLGALAAESYLVFDPAAEHWSIHPIPVTGTNAFYWLTADYSSPAGAQRLLTGSIPHRYLIGFRNDGELESLLMEKTGFAMPIPAAEKILPPLHWEWPIGYSLEHSLFVTDGKNLWALEPREITWWASKVKRVRFSDTRNATLFCFTPDAHTPLVAAVHFPMDQLPNPPIVNGQPWDIFQQWNHDNHDILGRILRHIGNMAVWLRVPGGLVLGGPEYCGHWFISDAALEEEFTAQRERRGPSTDSAALPLDAVQSP